MHENQIREIIEELIDTFLYAGKLSLKLREQGLIKQIKDDNTPVSNGDLEVNRILIEKIKVLTPDIPIVSEETSHNKTKTDLINFWLIDPLDGTKEFINRNGDFSVNISFIYEPRSIFGLVQRPTDMKVWTSLDAVSQTKTEQMPPLRIVMSRSHKREADTLFLKFLQDSEIDYKLVEKGSSLKICALCDDEADMYPRFGPTSEWDIAAADAVLASYGGSIFSLEDFEKLKYSKKNILNPPFIAYRNELIRRAYSQKVEDYVKKLL